MDESGHVLELHQVADIDWINVKWRLSSVASCSYPKICNLGRMESIIEHILCPITAWNTIFTT